MRHRVKVKTFNRDTKARKALLKGLLRSLLEQGSIETTKAKAKEIKRLADRLLAKAQEDSLAKRRVLHQFFGKRDIVNTIFDRIIPLFPNQVSGFTRITTIGKRRGDNTEMVTLALTKMPERTGTLKPEIRKQQPGNRKSVAVKKTAPVKATAKKTDTVKAKTKKEVTKKATAKQTTKK